MARGRFVSKEVCVDKRVNDLKDPWSMLGFTWLITHADVDGRTYGDPELVKSMIFPRQRDITVEDVERFIQEWQTAGMIDWYEVDGERFIQFLNFGKHQVGIRRDKEPASSIPDNPKIKQKAESVRQSDGKVPENVRNNGGKSPPEVKEKLREVKGKLREFEGNEIEPEKIKERERDPVPISRKREFDQAIGELLENGMSKVDFDTWVRPLELIGVEDGVYRLRAVNSYGRDWINNRVVPYIAKRLMARVEVTV